jgi:integrase
LEREVAGAKNFQLDPGSGYLTEPRRASSKIHRDVAAEREQPTFRFAKRHAFRPEPPREAETAPTSREVKHSALRTTRFSAFRRIDDGPTEHSAKLRQQRLGHSDAEMTLGVYSHIAKEDDIRVAAQLGAILDPSGPFQKTKGAAVGQQPLVD